MENVEWICDNGIWKAIQIEQVQNKIKKTKFKDLDETKIKIFEQFMALLSRKP